MRVSFYFEVKAGELERRVNGDVESDDGVGIAITVGDDFDQLFIEPMIHTCGGSDEIDDISIPGYTN